MNIILFGLTSFEKDQLNLSNLSRRAWNQIARSSSSMAPAPPRVFKANPQSSLIKFSLSPPRYFTRGARENDRKKHPLPDFYLLTETNETPRAQPLPYPRKLLRPLCRGTGTLRRNDQGYIYLDVDNQFILALLPFLIAQGLSRPPYFNLFSSPVGAHIPVISSRESFFNEIGPIQELNREFSFEIEGFYSVRPSLWPEVEQVWYFKAISSGLEQLRRKYFLSALPGGHSFAIATAIQPARAKTHSTPMFRISPAAFAA